jgi:hypothetical protein
MRMYSQYKVGMGGVICTGGAFLSAEEETSHGLALGVIDVQLGVVSRDYASAHVLRRVDLLNEKADTLDRLVPGIW